MRSRIERWLPWIAGAVLVAGIAAFTVSRLSEGGSPTAAAPKQVPLAAAAKRAAFRFVETAVARKDLAESYRLVTPTLRQGMSLAEWKTGTIPVQPYPVSEAAQRWHVRNSYPTSAQLEVAFVPKKGSSAGTEVFAVGLRKLGGRWLVDSFQPRGAIHAPSGQ
jgi:hypothetical protein